MQSNFEGQKCTCADLVESSTSPHLCSSRRGALRSTLARRRRRFLVPARAPLLVRRRASLLHAFLHAFRSGAPCRPRASSRCDGRRFLLVRFRRRFWRRLNLHLHLRGAVFGQHPRQLRGCAVHHLGRQRCRSGRILSGTLLGCRNKSCSAVRRDGRSSESARPSSSNSRQAGRRCSSTATKGATVLTPCLAACRLCRRRVLRFCPRINRRDRPALRPHHLLRVLVLVRHIVVDVALSTICLVFRKTGRRVAQHRIDVFCIRRFRQLRVGVVEIQRFLANFRSIAAAVSSSNILRPLALAA